MPLGVKWWVVNFFSSFLLFVLQIINSKIFSRTGAYQGIGFAIPSNIIVQIATQLIKFGEVRTLWIGNFRVLSVRINNNNSIINGLRIVEMQNTGPLFEKGINSII